MLSAASPAALPNMAGRRGALYSVGDVDDGQDVEVLFLFFAAESALLSFWGEWSISKNI